MTRFTREIAQKALDIAMPFLEQIIKQEERKGISVNIGYRNPVRPQDTKANRPIYGLTIGDGEDYIEIAMSKYELTLETGLSSREVQLLHPEATGGKDQTKFWGSWIDGFIIVAISGLPPEWDEACSKFICGVIKALLTTQSIQDFASDKKFT